MSRFRDGEIRLKNTLKDRITKEVLQEMYVNQRKSISEIARHFNCGYGSINRLLSDYEIPKRSSKEGLAIHFENHTNIDVGFFKQESPELYYILGLWASDGCAIKGGGLKLTMCDRDVIEWVKEKIGYANKVFEQKPAGFPNARTAYTLTFYNQEVAKIFEKHGIVQNKSLTLKFPEIPRLFIRDFIRGVFDGDGSISVGVRSDNGARTQSFRIVSGSFDFIKGIERAIKDELQIRGNKIITDKRGSGMYEYRVSRRQDVAKIAEWLYQDDAFGMKRKKEKMLQVLEMAC